MEPALSKLSVSVERSRTRTTRLLTLTLCEADDAGHDGDDGKEDRVTTQGVDFEHAVTG